MTPEEENEKRVKNIERVKTYLRQRRLTEHQVSIFFDRELMNLMNERCSELGVYMTDYIKKCIKEDLVRVGKIKR